MHRYTDRQRFEYLGRGDPVYIGIHIELLKNTMTLAVVQSS